MSSSPTLGRGAYREFVRVREVLRQESVGGILLILGAAVAMVTANVAPQFYLDLRHLHVGTSFGPIDLNLSLAHWAADGLLAVFFFLVGLELKHEFVVGDLRDPKTALVPVVAAIGGVALPAGIYVAATFSDATARAGWAIPAATDIAFALAVLAVIGSNLPAALRTFLLTLAVADDLIAITIIAIFYAHDVQLLFFGGALVAVAVFGLLAYRGQGFFLRHPWASWLLLPVGLLAWALTYTSGIHATVAGVLLGFAVPTRPPRGSDHPRSLSDELEHRLRPFSASIAVPVFAFFSAGVTLSGWDGFVAAVTSPIGIGVIAGLVVGKAVGISGATWLVTRLRHASLDPDLAWIDVIGMAILGGIGFTVSLLVSELSFGQGSATDDIGKVSVLTASLVAAGLAAIVLGLRNRHYREVAAAEELDSDADGMPDKFDH
ncbi:MAG: Na+/H+ antiporter NhaA [Propionibacteriales bacterium]|nr:Na+/H+ antiporter NhaA [Propionibacteriales bacterium]